MKAVIVSLMVALLISSSTGFQGAEGADRFYDHGVVVPTAASRGTVAAVDDTGRNIVLSWLFDHRGGYALLMIDANTGKTEQFPVPFPADGDGPWVSLLSGRHKFYTHFNSYFVEFDVSKRAFTCWRKTVSKTAMSMTEDDKGIIWSATYPQCGIMSFNPVTGQLKDYGHVYKQNWEQYPRSIAADDKGWIYVALGFTASQIVAFNPSTGAVLPVFPEGERKKGMAYLYRDMDGRVYGKALENDTTGWYKLYDGKSVKIGEHGPVRPKEITAGGWGFIQRSFPDGRRIAELDLVARRLDIEDPHKTGNRQEIPIEYSSDGATIMTVSAIPGGAIYGATQFPFHFFSYEPKISRINMENTASYKQWNAVVSQGDKVYVGGYPGGVLLEWDPSRPWQKSKNKPGWNPQDLDAWGAPIVNRPSKLVALPDGKTIIMAGTPEYGFTGGGLVFWDRETRKMQLLGDRDIMPDQSTNSMVVLPGNMLLGGTTVAPGTGGAKKARAAELYLMDMTSKKVLWHEPLFPTLQEYTDLCPGPQGVVYGMVNRHHFFVFDPVHRKLISKEDVAPKFGLTVWQQGPRVFVPGPNQYVYVLFEKGIARIDPGSHSMTWLADSPVPITAGGVYLDGRVYFASGKSHLYSYAVE